MKKMLKKIAVLILVWMCVACVSVNDENIALKGYNWSNPKEIKLPEILKEISGICFIPGMETDLLAIQDEDGILFKINTKTGQIQQTSFGKAGDYEDISVLDSLIFVLRSDGAIFAFDVDSIGKSELSAKYLWEKVLPKAEYEGLYADSETKTIYALPKEDKGEKKSGVKNIYALKFSDGNLKLTETKSLSISDIAAKSGKKNLNFKPSAITKNNKNTNWYILSSTNNCLVEYSSKWELLNVYKLPKKQFLQPEGIVFDSKGNLYISSEGDALKSGYILSFDYLGE